MNPRHSLAMALLLCGATASLSTSAHAEGPSTSTYPYGKKWVGNRYGPAHPWWSAGLILGAKPSRTTSGSQPRIQLMTGLEGRYHLHPRFAFVFAAQFSGHKVERTDTVEYFNMSDENSDSGAIEEDFLTEYKYSEGAWSLGIDFGIWETKTAHFQVGPRIGIQKWTSTMDIDTGDLEDEVIDLARKQVDASEVSGADPFGGVTARIGVFPTPAVEIGLHGHFEYIYGLQGGDDALATTTMLVGGPYTVIHF